MVTSWVKESRAKALTRNFKIIVVLESANAQSYIVRHVKRQ